MNKINVLGQQLTCDNFTISYIANVILSMLTGKQAVRPKRQVVSVGLAVGVADEEVAMVNSCSCPSSLTHS